MLIRTNWQGIGAHRALSVSRDCVDMCRHRYSASLNSDIPKVLTDIPKVIKMKSKAVVDHEGKE